MSHRPATRRTDLLTICWLVGRGDKKKGYKASWECGREAQALSTAAMTGSISMPFMQRKSIGHARKKHGEHGALDFNR